MLTPIPLPKAPEAAATILSDALRALKQDLEARGSRLILRLSLIHI